MPVGWKIATWLVFAIIMLFVVKPGARYVVDNGGWLGFIIMMTIIFGVAFLVDRSDKKKKAKLEEKAKPPEQSPPIKESLDDQYLSLGLSPGADPVVVQAAYRALAKKYHPDTTVENSSLARRRFREISDAHSAISEGAPKSQFKKASTAPNFQESQEPYKYKPPPQDRRFGVFPILAIGFILVGVLFFGTLATHH